MFKHYKSLIVPILVTWCETWTLMVEAEKEKTGFENKCLRKLHRIYCIYKSNHCVQSKVKSHVCGRESLFSTIKHRKIAWFGHVTRHNCICTTIMQGTVEVEWHRKSLLDNIEEWMDMKMPKLMTDIANKLSWRRLSISSVLMYHDDRSSRGTDNDN